MTTNRLATLRDAVLPPELIRETDLMRLIVGQAISSIGDRFYTIALAVLAFQLTGSALSVVLMYIATLAPSLIFGLVGGALVDRHNRKTLMLLADLGRGLLVLALPLLARHSLAWVYIITFAVSVISQIFIPAKLAALPVLAPPRQLLRANAYDQMLVQGAELLGPAAAGVVIATLGVGAALLVNAGSFLVSALFIWRIRRSLAVSVSATTKRGWKAVVKDLGAAWSFIRSVPVVRATIGLSAIGPIAMGAYNAVLVVFVYRVLQGGPVEFGLLETTTAVGFVLGAFLVNAVAERLTNYGRMLTLGLVGMAVAYTLVALSSSLPLAFVSFFLVGFVNPLVFVAVRTLLQANTPDSYRGRVFGFMGTVAGSAMILGMATAGLADLTGAVAIVAGAAILLAVAAGVALSLPAYREPQSSSTLPPP